MAMCAYQFLEQEHTHACGYLEVALKLQILKLGPQQKPWVYNQCAGSVIGAAIDLSRVWTMQGGCKMLSMVYNLHSGTRVNSLPTLANSRSKKALTKYERLLLNLSSILIIWKTIMANAVIGWLVKG